MNTEYAFPQISRQLHRWLLQLLVPLGGHRMFIIENGFSNELIAEALGLLDIELGEGGGANGGQSDGDLKDSDLKDSDQRENDPIKPFQRSVEVAKLRAMYYDAMTWDLNSEPKTESEQVLAHNLNRLQQLIGLSALDCQILSLMVQFNGERLLDDAADCLGFLSSNRALYVVALMLGANETEVRHALRDASALSQSGLLRLNRSSQMYFTSRFDLLSYTFSDQMMSVETDPMMLLKDTIGQSESAHLALSDFSHLDESIGFLMKYLEHALSQERKGVNIFIYGLPGTGKTQLVKTVADALNAPLFEVAHENEDGDPILGERRLRALNAGQRFFAQQRVLMVFDEVEDVFNDADKNGKSTAQNRKAWMNRTLEGNVIPTFWISNQVDGLDPAFVRRFDMMIQVPIPPKPQRARLIAQSCAGMIDTHHVDRMSEAQGLAPAIITRAASVVQSIREQLDDQQAPKFLDMLVSNTLVAQGQKALPKRNTAQQLYDPAFINSDAAVSDLLAGLREHQEARICLYGPPGTGKTALAHWLANELGMPLLIKRASDLLSMYVGEAEKNMAMAFEQAKKDKAVLLLDEVDSFLRDRRGAQQSWEVTEVNEMLTQMEAFQGVLIASTNLMTSLDQAAMRRFDLKMKFDYLTETQAWQLFDRYVQHLLGRPAEPEHRGHLKVLRALTPGDFAVVLRRSRFQPLGNEMDMIKALRAECALKDTAVGAIGFLS